MGKALRNRFNGDKGEFLQDCKRFGRDYALDIWRERLDGYSSYIGLLDFLEAETGDRDFGRNPEITTSGGMDLGRQIIHAMRDYFLTSEADKREMAEQIKYLNWQLEQEKIRNLQEASLLIDTLKAKEI